MMKYNSYKDSEIDWLGEVPSNWQVLRVKDITQKIGSGVTPKGGSEVYVDSGIPLLRSQNVYDDGLRIEDVSFIDEETHQKMKNSQLKPFDILINITGASIGRTCVVPETLPTANINQHIIFIRIKKSLVPYASYYFKSNALKEYINLIQAGSSKEALNMGQTLSTPIVLPNEKEQTAIAEYLDTKTKAIDKKVSLLEKKIGYYKELRKSLINETVTKGLDKKVKFKGSGVDWIGKIPEHWEVRRLKDISRVNRGASPRPIDDPIYFDDEGEFSWVRIADLTASERYLQETKERLSDLGASLSVKRYPGDFILSIAGTVGKPIISKIKCCIHDGFVWFSGLKINHEYLYYIFSTGLPYAGLGKLGTQLNLNTETVGLISIPIPPHSEITKIVDFLDEKIDRIDQIIANIQTQIATLKELRKTLINDVVTGKMKVIQD